MAARHMITVTEQVYSVVAKARIRYWIKLGRARIVARWAANYVNRHGRRIAREGWTVEWTAS